MPIPSLDALGAGSGIAPVAPTAPTRPTDGTGFASAVTGAVDELQRLQSTSNELSVAAVTGDLTDIHSAMIASSR
ncbi:flagellar hook-basal body complex protein FliE, partial [Microbacterium sp.]|uniref:flagellar hook-basal body complex protein FliE n=1 Tax=Microbacterium sp. TaxID=51671 RepID=UPI002811CAEE